MTATIFLLRTLAQDYGQDFSLEFLVELGWLLYKGPLIARKFLTKYSLALSQCCKMNLSAGLTNIKKKLIACKSDPAELPKS